MRSRVPDLGGPPSAVAEKLALVESSLDALAGSQVSSVEAIATTVAARTGNNFDLLGIAWQYRWGGGL